MQSVWLWLGFIAWVGVIYYFGRTGFGRTNTQALIDRFRNHQRLWKFLDRHHGGFRALFHYVEFGACYAVLYFAMTGGRLHWDYAKGMGSWALSFALAFLDEMHQKRCGGRCFRRIDLLHSMLGSSLIMLTIFISLLRRSGYEG